MSFHSQAIVQSSLSAMKPWTGKCWRGAASCRAVGGFEGLAEHLQTRDQPCEVPCRALVGIGYIFGVLLGPFIFGVTWLSWEQPHFRTGPFQSFKLLAVHGLHCLRSPITGRPGCKMLRNLELDHLCNWFLCALSLRVRGIWSVQTFS